MIELFAFLGMVVVIVVLMEVNERRKKRRELRAKSEERRDEDCPESSCAECGLHEVCEKEGRDKSEELKVKS